MLRLHVLSDLHTEMSPCDPGAPPCDVVVLAGDIGTGADPGTGGVAWIEKNCRGVPVVYVAGNHEYYQSSVAACSQQLRECTRGSSLHFLENDEIVLGGVRFLGCTLWTDFRLHGRDDRERAMQAAGRSLSDYDQIGKGTGTGRITPEDTRALHQASRAWLEERLAEDVPGPTVVVTHHAPSPRSVPGFALHKPIAPALASDLGSLIDKARIALWIHGHTHWCADYGLHGTRVLSNQKGYPHARVPGFRPELVITV